MQAKVGPTMAPGSGLSEMPADHRSTSSGEEYTDAYADTVSFDITCVGRVGSGRVGSGGVGGANAIAQLERGRWILCS